MGTESQSGEKARDERLRAVIADDDPYARRVIKDVLERAGVIVIAEARDGRQAVELTLHYQPDVVVMDVVMPELDGIRATRLIRRQLPEQLIIVLTSAADRRPREPAPKDIVGPYGGNAAVAPAAAARSPCRAERSC